jgi:F-type H+-transporting ATPase subunit b
VLIDWFTVGAQLLNFIILVWLLKRFLYKPILNAIDAREKRIATELADAERKKSEAQKERNEFQDQNKKFGEERDALMAKALLEVKVERERLLADARRLADELLRKQRTMLRDDAAALADQLRQLAAMEVFDIARKVLADLASADLEERMGEIFTSRLRQLKSEAKASLDAALKAPNASAIVRSRFGLGPKVQATIRNALNETFSADIGLSFDTAPDTLCGIELTVSGQRLSWDIAEYLKVLEQKAQALFSDTGKSAGAIPASKPPLVGVPLLTSPVSGSPALTPNGPAHAVASG